MTKKFDGSRREIKMNFKTKTFLLKSVAVFPTKVCLNCQQKEEKAQLNKRGKQNLKRSKAQLEGAVRESS